MLPFHRPSAKAALFFPSCWAPRAHTAPETARRLKVRPTPPNHWTAFPFADSGPDRTKNPRTMPPCLGKHPFCPHAAKAPTPVLLRLTLLVTAAAHAPKPRLHPYSRQEAQGRYTHRLLRSSRLSAGGTSLARLHHHLRQKSAAAKNREGFAAPESIARYFQHRKALPLYSRTAASSSRPRYPHKRQSAALFVKKAHQRPRSPSFRHCSDNGE